MLLHLAVLLQEVIDKLAPRGGDVIFDATVGSGGHAAQILKKIVPGGKLIAVDRDPAAIEEARRRLEKISPDVIYIQENFRFVKNILKSSGVRSLNGAVFDLGLSSTQLASAERGFSFLREGPLDMRFNPGQGFSAREAVNKLTKEELKDIIRRYGEERYAGIIAGAIVAGRKKKRIDTTRELADIIQGAVARRYRGQKLHPACRTFQALRIHVNDELSALEEALGEITPYLETGARVCVISFHSLEDRIVKNRFRDMGKRGELKVITKKPIVPGWEEKKINPRSRSAKLRVAERV